ncbi:MAG: hypothetical protein MPJ05_04740 [Nitrosopumilus sp.]|nr:hypothetical protein [Nitrosopumilus sp.]
MACPYRPRLLEKAHDLVVSGDARDCRERARAERADEDPRYVLVLGD